MNLKNNTKEQLIEIIYLKKSDYIYETVQLAKSELDSRGIANAEVKKIIRRLRRAKVRRKLEDRREASNIYVFEFFFDVLLGILSIFD